MLVMVSNNTGWRTHYLQGRYGGLGLLCSPDGLRGPWPHLPYAVDNGAFSAFKNNRPWDEQGFLRAMAWIQDKPAAPLWVVVPDVVGDASQTYQLWHKWSVRLREYKVPLAFAVQDGMTPAENDRQGINPDVVFVGGTTKWKERTLATWCQHYPRVHVGRINSARGLELSARAGAESTDGTGWFRGHRAQLEGLIKFLERQTSPHPLAPMFFPNDAEGQLVLFEDSDKA